MILKLKKLVLLSFVFFSKITFATTWDEPWQDKVIKEADYFVFAKIKSYDEKKGFKIEVIKTLGGEELNGKIKIRDFYLLDLCSRSGGHGPEFHFKGIKECYLFIKKNDKGKYCIATPTSGFDHLEEGVVYATYRHSYHQALVPVDIYEKTMSAIFNHYHNLPYDRQYILEFVNKHLSLKPAGFSKEEINTFYDQHVALECVYHLRLTDLYSKILPFLRDTTNRHNQISAARALISSNTEECKKQLLEVVSDTTRDDFVQVMCIWTLDAFNPTELKGQLIKASETASTKHNGFGGNIMDPRVCTHIPQVKSALEDLVGKL